MRTRATYLLPAALLFGLVGCASVGAGGHQAPPTPVPVSEPAASESIPSDQTLPAPPPDADTESDWEFFVAIYGWLANLSGEVASGEENVDVTTSFSDLAKLAKGGFMMYAEARYQGWFLAFDGTWAMLGMDEEGRFLDVEVEVEQRIFDLRLGYEVYRRVYEEAAGPDDWRREGCLDLYVGVRYWYTEPTVNIRPVLGEKRQFSFSDERWDPIIGFRARYDVSKLFGLVFRADAGGFGIGDSSQLTWQVEALLGFRLSRVVALFGGFRAMHFDTLEGSGDERQGADLTQYGPLIGVGFRF